MNDRGEMALEARTIDEALARYDFYHCIEIAPGITTPGQKNFISLQAPVLAEIRSRDLRGKRVLDIGCRDGLFSFAAEAQGGEVLGIDNDLSRAAIEFLIPHLRSKVEMREVNLYDFAPEERFDFVVFAGVLYHLRFPFMGLKRIGDAMALGGTLLIETGAMLSYPGVPLLYSPTPKNSPYDPTSVTFFNLAGLADSLASFGFVDMTCISVIPHIEGVGSFPSMEAYLESDAARNTTNAKPVFGRIVCTCEYRPDANLAQVQSYWYGTHKLHADSSAAADMLERFGQRRLANIVRRNPKPADQ